MTEGKELTQAQRDVIVALLDERTVMGASKRTGVARSTIYSWLNGDPFFRREVGRARAKLFEEALDLLNAGAAKAIGKLLEALDHGSAGIRLKAAAKVAELAMEMKAGHELEAKLRELEERAGLLNEGRRGED
jgi:hypothetical protein